MNGRHWQPALRFLPRMPTAVVLAVALLAAACASDAEPGGGPTPGPSGTITIGAVTDRMSFDPHASEIGHQLQYLQPVYDTLLRETPGGELVPMLATEWSYHEGRTVLDLTLRDGVMFIDGEPFNAEAVAANLEHGKASTGPRAAVLGAVDRVEAADEFTARLHLSDPDPMLLMELASVMGMMVSPAALDNEDLDRNPVGTGPYLFQPDESSEGDRYVYELNPDYWDPSLQGVERIEIVLLANPDARLNALRAGQVDMAAGSAVQLADAEAAGLRVLTENVNWRGINLADRGGAIVPQLADPRVRRAMNHAIDRASIVETLEFGLGAPATQVYPRDDPANIDPAGERFPYDPALARDLLAEAGYPDGFTIETPLTTFVAFAPVAEAIVGYLDEIGIELRLNVIDVGNQVIGSWSSTEHPMAHISFGARHPSEIVRLFILEDGSFNPFRTAAPDVQGLLEEASRLPEEEATQRYAEIAEIVTGQAWFLITHVTEDPYFLGPRVEGVEMTPHQVVPSIYGWRVTG